jgi:outer membrane immunogenic protein
VKRAVIFAALLATTSLVSPALAADLGRPIYKAPPPAPIPVQDWSGIYVGLEGGYAWGDQNQNITFPGAVNADKCSGVKSVDGEGPPPFVVVGTGHPGFDCSGFNQFDHEFQYFNSQLANPAITLGNIKLDGWLGGGFFGAQKQWGSVVLGIEGDIDGANIKGSEQGSNSTFHSYAECSVKGALNGCDPISKTNNVSMDTKINMLASLRGKVGWSFAPDWLLYGTGGAAFARVQNTINQSASVNFCDEAYVDPGVCGNLGFARIISGSNSFSGTAGTTMFGWAAGAGLDWKWRLDAGSALVLGVEYLHYGFPEQTITLAGSNGGSFAFTAKENVDVVKGRISYLFSIH